MSAVNPLVDPALYPHMGLGDIPNGGGSHASASGLNHAGSSAHWQPPVPSMLALPVDMSKTEPKPAYYKLQFGDDYTGFSYYVRTLGIVIGRKCEKPMQVPPPDITSPQVPTRPPLDDGDVGDQSEGAVKEEIIEEEEGFPVKVESGSWMDVVTGQQEMDGGLSLLDPLLKADPVFARESVTPNEMAPIVSLQGVGPGPVDMPSEISWSDADFADATPAMLDAVQDLVGHTLEEQAFDQRPQLDTIPPAQAAYFEAAGLDGIALDESELEGDALSDAAIIQAMLGGPPPPPMSPPPPPPPPSRSSAPVEHVDVDLGPLKSVSRNHAKIEFRPDLGHFCLDIHGRNGAWVDDRYYVKGSAVPLYQGSVIQIATRIFSFILPPSPGGSPGTPSILDASFDSNTPLEDVPYPYNLPASQVGFEEFFGETLAGSVVPAASIMPHQVPQPFNAFTAPDGEGLGLGMEYDWSQDKRKGRHHWTQEWSSEDSEDSWDSWDESDEVEDLEISRRRRRRRRADEGESELSSVEEESEEGEEYLDDDDEEDAENTQGDDDLDEGEEDEDEDAAVKEEVMGEETTYPVHHKKAGRPKSTSISTNRRESLASIAAKDEPLQPVLTPARMGKGPAKSGKLPAKSVKAVKAMKAAVAAKKRVTGEEDDVMEGQSGTVEDAAEAKKGKKGKVEKGDKAPETMPPLAVASGPAEAKPADKPKPPPKKAGTKKAKAVPPPTPAAPLAPSAVPGSSAPMAAPSTPLPPPPPTTLAAALAAAVPPPASVAPPTAAPPASIRPPVPTPPVQAVRPAPVAPVRPAPIRPPLPTAQTPATPRPPIVQAISAQGTAASSPGGTPEPSKPFYLTELIETPGRPGHIIVNVPIPPSGAGPRPPPGPLIGLDGEVFIGPPPIKPTVTFAIIIYTALAHLPRGRGTLGEVCNWIAGEWEWFRLNVDTGWQNSIRHNLSLNKAFLKVPRIPEDDPESKGSVWIIDPKEGPIFEEKQRKEAQKSEGKTRTAEMRAVKDRQKGDDKGKKEAAPNTPVVTASGPSATGPPVVSSAPAVAAATAAAAPGAPTASQASTAAVAPAAARPGPAATVSAAPTAVPAGPAQARPPPPVRPTPVAVRPTVRPPAAAAAAPPAPKGPVVSKGRVAVSFNQITPALRAASLVQSLDNQGNPMPFVCTATDLILDPAAFGHLNSDITDKLHNLGAQVAVGVLTSWVNTKSKVDPAKAAAAKAGTPLAASTAGAGAAGTAASTTAATSTATAARPAPVRPNGAAKQARPPAKSAAQAKAAAAATATKSASAAAATATSTSTSKGPGRPPAHSTGSSGAVPKSTASGPSLPAGSTMPQIISLIAAAAAQGRDIQTVGKHANALLRYIKMVGMKVDVKVAERVWTTGIVPPNPNAAAKAGMMQNGAARNGVKPNGVGSVPGPGGQGMAKKVGTQSQVQVGLGGNSNLSPALQGKLPLKPSLSPSPAPPAVKLPTATASPSPSAPAPAPTPPIVSPSLTAGVPPLAPRPAVTISATTPAPPAQPAGAAPPTPIQVNGGLKRKLDESSADPTGSAGALAVPSPSGLAEAEAKKPRLEAGAA